MVSSSTGVPNRCTPSENRPDVSSEASRLLEGLLTPNQLAAELGVSWRTVHRLSPPAIRLGNKVLYNAATVREWILAREEQSRPEPRRGRPIKRAA